NGLLLVAEGAELRLVATDGHRLAFSSLELPASLPRQEAIVPRKTVLELTKLLTDTDDEVRIELSATQAGFSFGTIDLVSKLVDVLNNVPGAELECDFGDASSSALISYENEKGFKYVVMPMRI